MLLEIRDGTVTRGGNPVLSHFNFEIRGQEKIAIVGKNGAGKTTLLEVLAGERPLDRDDKAEGRGQKRFSTARDLSITYIPQRMNLDPEARAQDLLSGDSVLARRLFTELGFSLDDLQKKIREFSGGEQRKIQLLRGFLEESDLLILDEPTNHLDLLTTNKLEHFVRSFPKALIYVSHDRYFMDETAEVIWEISKGKLTPYVGNYSSYRKEKREKVERQAKAYERQKAEIQREEELIKRFRNKARKAAFARSRQKILDRMEKVEPPAKEEARIHEARIHSVEILPHRLGAKWVLQCENLKIGYGKHVIRQVDFRIKRGQKIGIIGPNGAGKSTFLKTIVGKVPKISGKMTLGNQIDLAYFDQDSANLTSEKSVHDWYLNRFPSLTEKELRKTLASYLFIGEDLKKRVSDLSGGEKSKLLLSALLEERPNFLLLDEPTNHMDIPARETLESILKSYKGTILFVSHDRYFLQEVATSLLVFDFQKDTFTEDSDGDSLPGIACFPMDYRHYCRQLEKTKTGDMAALRSAEDQKLIDDLHSIPKKSPIQTRPLTNREETMDWYFARNREKREAAERKLEEASAISIDDNHEKDSYMTLEEYMALDDSDPMAVKEAEDAEEDLTESLLDWYDLWLETPEGRKEIPPEGGL
ncbi:MAG: ABC-F family ATP-binding cassette domain-containing protein [Lachnospiraceae bacterium]|nr:ABC-F family ATP-binding cassette domain-containing protein [Lachnospiraceae bacterium]